MVTEPRAVITLTGREKVEPLFVVFSRSSLISLYKVNDDFWDEPVLLVYLCRDEVKKVLPWLVDPV